MRGKSLAKGMGEVCWINKDTLTKTLQRKGKRRKEWLTIVKFCELNNLVQGKIDFSRARARARGDKLTIENRREDVKRGGQGKGIPCQSNARIESAYMPHHKITFCRFYCFNNRVTVLNGFR